VPLTLRRASEAEIDTPGNGGLGGSVVVAGALLMSAATAEARGRDRTITLKARSQLD